MKRFYALSTLLLFAGFGAAAHADTIPDDGATYTLTYSTYGAPAGSYLVFLQVNTSGYIGSASPSYLQSVALELDPNQTTAQQPTVALLDASAGFSDFVEKDKGSGNGGCTNSGNHFFCDEYATNALGAPAGPGDVYNFEFLVTPDPAGGLGVLDFDTLADTIEANYNYTTTNPRNGNVTTHNGELVDDQITLSAAPEPASIALLGTALLGFAGFARKFRTSH